MMYAIPVYSLDISVNAVPEEAIELTLADI